MGSSTLRYTGLYQELAEAAREAAGAQAVILSRLERDTMMVRPAAVSPSTAGTRARGHGFTDPRKADAHPDLRRVYVGGRPVSAPARKLFDGAARTSTARGGWATVLPLRTPRGIGGSLAFLGARRPDASSLRRFREIARFISPMLQLSEDAREYAETAERARREAAALLHGTHAALLAIRHRLGESRNLLTARPSEAASILENARDELERIGERDIGRTSRLLFPLAIRMSLTPALEALADRYRPAADVAVLVDEAVARADDPFENRLPIALRVAIYRVVEASVAGAAGRGAKNIDVSLTRSGGQAIAVSIRDPSRTPPQAAERATGDLLLPLHEWGGTLTISASRARGTTLAASFPLPAPDGAPGGTVTPRSPR